MRRTVTALRYFGAAVTFLLRRFALHAKETTIPSCGAVCAFKLEIVGVNEQRERARDNS